MRIVLDTNTLISALGWKKGNERRLLQKCIQQDNKLVLSKMKNKKLLYGILVVIVLIIIVYGLLVLEQLTMPGGSDLNLTNFNLIFKYGVNAKSVLNTFEGTYTKDMIADPPITVNLSLSEEEKDKIYKKMIEIDFFDYPDKFSVFVFPGESTTTITPHYSYYFKVEYNSKIKELWWNDNIIKEDKKAENLRELIKLIINIIESKEEYKKLPAPKGGYL